MLDETIRQPRIGGSEIAAVFNLHDYLDSFGLWARKKGNLPRDEASYRMRLGKHLEQGIVSYAAELEGWEYEWCDKTSKSEQYPFMVYTPDALIPAARAGIDAKLVGWDQSHRWGRTVNDIPDHAVMQGWWYMAALDYCVWYIAALVVGEDRPRIYRVERNAPAERIMLRKAKEYWERYLVGDERPPITASDAADRWLKKTYPRPQRAEIANANDDEIATLEQYAQVRRLYQSIDKERKDLEAAIKAAIGERSGLQWPGGKFTWKATRDSIVTDWANLADALLKTHPAAEQLLEEYTHVKPGSRRIYFKGINGEESEL